MLLDIESILAAVVGIDRDLSTVAMNDVAGKGSGGMCLSLMIRVQR